MPFPTMAAPYVVEVNQTDLVRPVGDSDFGAASRARSRGVVPITPVGRGGDVVALSAEWHGAGGRPRREGRIDTGVGEPVAFSDRGCQLVRGFPPGRWSVALRVEF